MKKLILSTLLVGLNSIVFSQIVTDSVTCIPTSTAKKIAKDLVRGDSAIAELNLTNKLVFELENKIVLQDSVISSYKTIEKLCVDNLTNEVAKNTLLEKKLAEVKQMAEKEKKNKLKFSIGTGILVAIISILI